MRLGGRLQAAIEVLDDIEKRHRPAADALRDWGLSHRFAGSGDRAAIGNLVYDALRLQRSATAMLGAEPARAAAFGALLQAGHETADTLDAALVGDRFGPEPLSEDERHAIGRFDRAALPDAVAANVPDWCVGELQSAFGGQWKAEADALARRPSLDMRVNTLKADRDRVLSALQRAGASRCRLAPQGLRIAPVAGHGRHPNVQAESAFGRGWFEVQDEGSQIAALIAAGDSPGQLLDYCAGAGGKTLAISASYANKGQIFAYDADRQRLAPIFDRLRRAGCRNVQVVDRGEALEELAGRMDTVLVDAPCTGSGTWRRRPDAKWRLSPNQFEARRREQATILDAAAGFVRPGGRLVYVTCSVFPSENDAQIAAFLARFPAFSGVDMSAQWSARFPGHEDKAQIGEHGILLTPARSGTDGFFISVLTRH